MRTRENSVVISLRIEKELQQEFVALANELGVLTARILREMFLAQLTAMREKVNEKRRTNGLLTWEEDWANRSAKK